MVSDFIVVTESAILQGVTMAMRCGEILGLSGDMTSSVWTVIVLTSLLRLPCWPLSSDDVSGEGGGVRRAEE